MRTPSTTYRTLRRLTGAFLLAMLVVAGGALATKRISYVVTNGVSMQPVYHAGDLVVVARSSSYQQGDIVAYHGGAGRHTEVLHRIVGGDAGGYVFKGDNNQSVDPLELTADQLSGRAVVHIPKVGAILQSPITRGLVLLTVVVLLGALIVSPTSKSSAGEAPAERPARRPAAWKTLVGADVALAAGLALTFVVESSPPGAPRPAAAPVNQTGVLAYRARAPLGDTYPSGQIVTGDPVFVKLVNTLGVSFHYSTDGPAGAVTGNAQVDAEVSNASGWHTSLQVVVPTPLIGGGADLAGTLDLARIQALADSVAKATGAAAGSIDVTVTASASVSVDGAEPKTYTSELPFKLTPLALTPVKLKTIPSADGPVVSSTNALATPARPAAKPAHPNHDLRTGLVVALLLGLAVTALTWPSPTETVGDATVYARALGADLGDTAQVQLADAAALDAVAATLGAPVIEGDGWLAVLAAGVVYWTGTALPKTLAGASPPALATVVTLPDRR